MREILFRGKRIDSGEWVYGGYAVTENQVYLIYNQADSIDLQGFTVDENTIGPYTGLTDKNGKKIFEGDIVFYWCSDVTAVVKYGQYIDTDSSKQATGFYVEYLEDGETVQENMDSRESDEEYGCEVIGNIHDNPELLEGKP